MFQIKWGFENFVAHLLAISSWSRAMPVSFKKVPILKKVLVVSSPSHPLPSGNSRLGALNWPLLWRSSWVKHVKEFLFGIQTPWRWFSKTELYLFFPTQTLSLLLLIYFDFYMQFTTWGSCSSWWPYFVWESCFSCTLFQNGGKLFFHPMITGPKSILSI